MPRAAVKTKTEVTASLTDKVLALFNEEGKGDLMVIHNKYHSNVTLPHPSIDASKDMTWEGDEYKVMDMAPEDLAVWLRSSHLRRLLREGTFEVVTEAEIPPVVTLPPHLAVRNPHYQETLRQILGHNEALITDILNMKNPEREPGFLKNTMLPVFKAALYTEQRSKKRQWLLDGLEATIKRINESA